jgi:hypothetical protein
MNNFEDVNNLKESYRYMVTSEIKKKDGPVFWSSVFIIGEQAWNVIQAEGSTWFYSLDKKHLKHPYSNLKFNNSHFFAPYTNAQDVSDALCLILDNLEVRYTISTCEEGWVIQADRPVAHSLANLREQFEKKD